MRRARTATAGVLLAVTATVLPGGPLRAELPPASTFHGVSPARLVDTRTSASAATVDGFFLGGGPLGPGEERVFAATRRADVPNFASTVVLNVTAINPTEPSFLTLYPAGAPRPHASNLNLAPGRTLPNLVVVPVGQDGGVRIYNDRGTTHVAIDVLGWFPAWPAFAGVTPARFADTRTTGATTDGNVQGTGPLTAGATLTIPIAGRGTLPATGIGAVALNITAINPTQPSFLTAYPSDQPRPHASNLNLAPGRTLPNMAIVPLADDGTITVYNDRGTAHVAIDVLGWFPITASNPSTSRVSVHTDGSQGNGPSFRPAVSGDGRFVAFDSEASTLVTNDMNGAPDVFVRELATGVTDRVSVSSLGVAGNSASTNPSISYDGRYVAFQSLSGNLVPGDEHLGSDVYVHDRHAGTTEKVSVSSSGAQGNGASVNPSISADGRYVAFQSAATNLVTGDTNAAQDIFVHDRVAGTTTRVNLRFDGNQTQLSSFDPMISADGRHVTYRSFDDFLVEHDTNVESDVFVHDRHSGVTRRVNVSSGGAEANHPALAPSVSGDGRYVTFYSRADTLGLGITNNTEDIFVRDVVRGATWRISTAPNGDEANGPSYDPVISANGSSVTFFSFATNLVDGDTNGVGDVFVHNLLTGVTSRVSVSTAGVQGNDHSYGTDLSADGRVVAFRSVATNLVPLDTNGHSDIFVRDRGSF